MSSSCLPVCIGRSPPHPGQGKKPDRPPAGPSHPVYPSQPPQPHAPVKARSPAAGGQPAKLPERESGKPTRPAGSADTVGSGDSRRPTMRSMPPGALGRAGGRIVGKEILRGIDGPVAHSPGQDGLPAGGSWRARRLPPMTFLKLTPLPKKAEPRSPTAASAQIEVLLRRQRQRRRAAKFAAVPDHRSTRTHARDQGRAQARTQARAADAAAIGAPQSKPATVPAPAASPIPPAEPPFDPATPFLNTAPGSAAYASALKRAARKPPLLISIFNGPLARRRRAEALARILVGPVERQTDLAQLRQLCRTRTAANAADGFLRDFTPFLKTSLQQSGLPDLVHLCQRRFSRDKLAPAADLSIDAAASRGSSQALDIEAVLPYATPIVDALIKLTGTGRRPQAQADNVWEKTGKIWYKGNYGFSREYLLLKNQGKWFWSSGARKPWSCLTLPRVTLPTRLNTPAALRRPAALRAFFEAADRELTALCLANRGLALADIDVLRLELRDGLLRHQCLRLLLGREFQTGGRFQALGRAIDFELQRRLSLRRKPDNSRLPPAFAERLQFMEMARQDALLAAQRARVAAASPRLRSTPKRSTRKPVPALSGHTQQAPQGRRKVRPQQASQPRLACRSQVPVQQRLPRRLRHAMPIIMAQLPGDEHQQQPVQRSAGERKPQHEPRHKQAHKQPRMQHEQPHKQHKQQKPDVDRTRDAQRRHETGKRFGLQDRLAMIPECAAEQEQQSSGEAALTPERAVAQAAVQPSRHVDPVAPLAPIAPVAAFSPAATEPEWTSAALALYDDFCASTGFEDLPNFVQDRFHDLWAIFKPMNLPFNRRLLDWMLSTARNSSMFVPRGGAV
ncbi:MAG: hypothetical protein ACRYGK_18505 [Janthinobacterium lividum]